MFKARFQVNLIFLCRRVFPVSRVWTRSREELREGSRLRKEKESIEKKAKRCSAPALVHREMALAGGLIRDVFTEQVDRVVLDDAGVYKEIVDYLKWVSPDLVSRVHLYKGRVPVFDEYGVEGEIEKSFDRKVWLKRGG